MVGKVLLSGAFVAHVHATKEKHVRRLNHPRFELIGRTCEKRVRNLLKGLHIHKNDNVVLNSIGDVALAQGDVVVKHLAKWLSALAVALLLHGGTPGAADAYMLASATEDKLLGVIRAIETKTDSALTGLSNLVTTPSSSGDADALQDAVEQQKALVDEVHDVVRRNFDDSRHNGYTDDGWQSIRDSVVSRKLSDASSTHSAIREMLLTLKDPYTRFLSADEFSAMSKYDISGVGLNLGTKDDLQEKTGLIPKYSSNGGGAWVVGLIRSSAADAAGIQQGDLLVSIDDVPLDQKTPFEVASLIQSPTPEREDIVETGWFGISKVSTSQSPPLHVKVKRITGEEMDIELQRPQVVPTPSPVSYSFDERKNSGYIKLSSFNARAQRDVSRAVSDLVEHRGATSLTLDLRGNRGGLVSEGIEVAKIFLSNDDVIVRSKLKARTAENVIRATNPKPLTDVNLSVLVDGGTASASEILAGALQDNCRAPLIGQKTYGKGLIQSVYELSDGSGLVLTVGSYLTPTGINIDWEGLTPDFSSQPQRDEDIKSVLQACRVRNGSITSSSSFPSSSSS
ncbi:Carboxyl-terminal-processing peptidase 1 [Picochlorum sp. SENEW3]|nr:Carboxyl-terminal-processing peptidase 1 [Picochlorum sp. SENEW3]